MIERTIEILTPHHQLYQTCVMGNEAIARAAIEAGVNGVFSYPGTPSTEISEIFNHVCNFQNEELNKLKFPGLATNPVYFEYSINEKIALEKAIAFSIGNKSALCVMKNVGMNIASDALMSVTYQTIVAPLVIVVCDDPGCHSSSNEQDSRHWGPMASVPVFNPATPDEAFEMIKHAFDLSGQIKLPVIVRTTTRVSHTRGIVTYGNIADSNREAHFDRLPEHINIPARTATAHVKLLNKLKTDGVLDYLKSNSKKVLENNGASFGIISSGVASAYILEILEANHCANNFALLSLGLIHPFPEQEVLDFISGAYEKILIMEELDAFVENATRNLVQQNNIGKNIFGKGFSELTAYGEFSIDLVTKVLEDFSGLTFEHSKNIPLNNQDQFLDKLPPRPPTLCAGCPHRATFYLLKLAIPREQSELIMCGDIGCFGLGALPPLKMIDTINHMGMSISMAQGLYESFNASEKSRKVVALLGDGTFFHSGLTSLVNAVYTRANILVIIFDNRTIGMTGHQSHPGASRLPRYHEIEIPPLLKGLGVEFVESLNPFNINEAYEKVNKAMRHQGVSVLVSKAPCVFLPDFKNRPDQKLRIAVDPGRCNTCENHEDPSMSCSRCYSPKNNLSRAKAKLMADISIEGNELMCPANICNHGFFNSILEGDYKSAVEIIRDKMLFAKTCGDICHRPCELFSHSESVIPIKYLKHFVTGVDDNYRDFSVPVTRVKNAHQKNKSIAIIGAGPAGLSAAFDFVQKGYQVEIFEKENLAGGMVTHAIPKFRMDKAAFEFEAMQLVEMGVVFHFEKALGIDFTLDALTEKYDAILLAIGMNKAKVMEQIANHVPASNTTDALTFLKLYNQHEKPIPDGSVVLVIGGGNSAIDAARSARKLSSQNRVLVSCIEAENDMPAFEEEVMHAKNEGIEFVTNSYVQHVQLVSQNKIEVYLHAFGNQIFLDSVVCDFIITAIGQTSDNATFNNLDVDALNRVHHDNNSYTGYKNVFVAGDIAAGNNMSVIGAIASGKKAVIAVRKLLEAYPYSYEGETALERLNANETPRLKTSNSINEEDFINEIEKYNLFQSCKKCNHCIDNFGCPAMMKVHGKVQIDASRCTLCGLCIDVCPNDAIHWVTEKVEEFAFEA